jgi:hypothetical protein
MLKSASLKQATLENMPRRKEMVEMCELDRITIQPSFKSPYKLNALH